MSVSTRESDIGPQPTDIVDRDTNGVFQDAAAGKLQLSANPRAKTFADRLPKDGLVVLCNGDSSYWYMLLGESWNGATGIEASMTDDGEKRHDHDEVIRS